MPFVLWPSREEQSISQPVSAGGAGTMTKLQRPKPIDLDWLSAGGMHQADRFKTRR